MEDRKYVPAASATSPTPSETSATNALVRASEILPSSQKGAHEAFRSSTSFFATTPK